VEYNFGTMRQLLFTFCVLYIALGKQLKRLIPQFTAYNQIDMFSKCWSVSSLCATLCSLLFQHFGCD